MPDAGNGDDRLRWIDHTVGSFDLSGADSVESDMIAGGPGDLFVVFVSTKPAREVTGVSGLDLEWMEARQICSGRSTAKLAMFWGLTSVAVAGKVTAALGITAGDGGAVISVHRYAGADPSNPIGHTSVANSTGHDGDLACSGGIDSDMYSWSALDTAAIDSIVVSGVHTANYPSHAAGDGFTERSDDQSGATSSSAGVAVEERRIAEPTSNVTVSGGWENAPDWAAIAAELRD